MDATAPGIGVRAAFTGEAKHFFRIALIGNLLQIPTFGFYRFWLITDLRRHLWSHTRIGGEAFEYTGRGRELLIGFLIAMAILTPLYVGYFLLSIEAERWRAFASLPLLFLIYVLMHYGTYRARRYRATRTVFRGIRLWMTGSGWAYAARAVLWDLVTILTLGLALPWRAAALERYRMRHTFFGDIPGAFTGRGWIFFKRGWWLWLMATVPLVLLVVAAVSALQARGSGESAPAAAAFIPLAIVLWLPALFLGYPLYRAISTRWFLEGIRFGELSITSTLRKRSVLWAYGKAMLIGGIASGVVGIIFATILESLGLSFEGLNQMPVPPVRMLVLLAGFYLVALMIFAIVNLQFITRGVWMLAAESVMVLNLAALDAANARGAAAGSLGEGLADALDFGGGLGV